MFSTSNELVVLASRVKLVAVAIGAAVLSAASAWLLETAPEEDWLNLAIGVVFFAACGAYALFRSARPRPVVVINREGIMDNASAISVGFIRWDEIDELREYRFEKQVFLGIVPRDLDALLARQSAWKRNAIRANLLVGALPVNIPQAVLPMKVTDLLREINARFRDSDAGGHAQVAQLCDL